MVEPKENLGNDPGAAGGNEPTPIPAPTAPKMEFKDGQVLVDGKKMVKESDLIAAKQGLESAAATAQTVHNEAIDTVNLELSSERQKAANLTAELEQAKQASATGAISEEEVATIKQERDNALTKVGTLQTDADKALAYRREMLVTKYSIPADSIKDKTMVELDSFEEAVKALATSRGGGLGPYALGGGLGGVTPMTEDERAAKILENTPVRGVRTAEPAQK